MKEINVFVGKKFKERREDLNLTQEFMAKELDIAQNHYGRIERGENSCTMDNFIHICNLLHATPNEIVGGLVITAEEKVKNNFDKLNLEDRMVISKLVDYFLSQYNKK